ncbi:MAG: hypothetical protein Q9227_000887 [Pyrenula ochraceoflavens]
MSPLLIPGSRSTSANPTQPTHSWVMLPDPTHPSRTPFIPLPGERILHTTPSRISLSINTPKAYPGGAVSISSPSGIIYLTNSRMVYLPTAPTDAFQSFAAPIGNLHDTHVTTPYFGPNTWTAHLIPTPGGHIPSTQSALSLSLTFKDGGAFDLHTRFEQLKERLSQIRDTSHLSNPEFSRVATQGQVVDLEQLPAYAPPESNSAAAATMNAAASAAQASPSAEGVERHDDSTFEAPTEPPPGYEEVQQQSVVEGLERLMSGEDQGRGGGGRGRRGMDTETEG